jgi:transcriptional regulator with XRE-family HTH domain
VPKTFTQRIRDARKEKGWSQDALAARLSELAGKKIPQQEVQRWEAGQEPEIEEFELLGRALDKSPAHLAFGDAAHTSGPPLDTNLMVRIGAALARAAKKRDDRIEASPGDHIKDVLFIYDRLSRAGISPTDEELERRIEQIVKGLT